MDMAIPSAAMALAQLAADQATERARRGDQPHSGDPRWYLVQCVHKSDPYVREWLGKLNFESYYPMVKEMRPVPKRKLTASQRKAEMRIMRPQVVPFFPRYIFVRFDIGRSGWRDIFGFAGIAGIHCNGDSPAPIADVLIAGLRANEIDGAIPGKTPSRMIFRLGERVRVVEGPFASFYGTVEKLADVPIEAIDPDTRIKVAVDIFGRSTPVELEVSQIAKLS
jgi:transcription antitermination factor NusG